MPDLHDEVARFFSPERWRTPMAEFERSGYALADEVNALHPRFVVDAGCGYNLFKGKISNLIGIDLVNPAADLICDLEDAPILPASIDVILALGAINYGSRALIERQLACLARWLTPHGRIIMRANPGMATGPGLAFFGWSEENIDPIGTAAGLRRDTPIHYDTYTNSKNEAEPRLVWHYRPATAPTASGEPAHTPAPRPAQSHPEPRVAGQRTAAPATKASFASNGARMPGNRQDMPIPQSPRAFVLPPCHRVS